MSQMRGDIRDEWNPSVVQLSPTERGLNAVLGDISVDTTSTSL